MVTLNMVLDLPVVSTTPGPTYATLLNAAMEDIDAHDHTSGKGVQVPSAGLNINADLTFNSNAATSLTFLGLEAQDSAPSTNLSVYVDNSNDLYYKNSSGTSVQLTTGGTIASAGSGIITYSLIATYPYSVVVGDAQKVLGIDTSAARTLNLPAAVNAMWFKVKDVIGTASTYNITVSPNGSDTIDTAASHVINENFASRVFISDGVSKWFVV